jgi:hypothetical protein
MKKIICTVVVYLNLIAMPALCQQAEDVTEYKFEDTTLLGELIGTEQVDIVVRNRGREKSLIKVRTHFVPEMFKSVEKI